MCISHIEYIPIIATYNVTLECIFANRVHAISEIFPRYTPGPNHCDIQLGVRLLMHMICTDIATPLPVSFSSSPSKSLVIATSCIDWCIGLPA